MQGPEQAFDAAGGQLLQPKGEVVLQQPMDAGPVRLDRALPVLFQLGDDDVKCLLGVLEQAAHQGLPLRAVGSLLGDPMLGKVGQLLLHDVE
jgi:hypothetical protein